ncbi:MULTISPECIES: TraX family protein [unclassified Paenibacillus]|uniref:TraX family protein n=1 Tax=unclassified Paenibacillus TaxID=185978 RepID=UPI002F40596B
MIVIQFIAMLTMLIDHIGAAFFPEDSYFRVVGRIAFPLYAYLLVLGYGRTRNITRYTARLAVLALISQIPFSLLFHTYHLNAVATLLAALFTIRIIDHFRSALFIQMFVVCIAIFFMEFIAFDYGMYGLLLVLIYRYARPAHMLWLHIALNIIIGLFINGWFVQVYSFLATVLIVYFPLLLKQIDKIRIPRWLWLSFYPAHMLVLFAVQLLEKY